MTRLSLSLLLSTLLALVPALGSAQEAKPQSFPSWEQLTPAQRELLIAPIRDRWNREPEQRPRFMNYAKRWKSMPPPQRERARRGMHRWENMSPEQRERARALFHATRDMSKEDRRAFFANWKTMSAQQRTDWLKAHPAPERDHPRD